MKSIFSGEGYLLNDDRASGGKKTEDGILGCNHCQKALKKSEWKLQGGMCTGCSQPLCIECLKRVPTFGCEPFVKQLQEAVNNLYRREQNAKILGI